MKKIIFISALALVIYSAHSQTTMCPILKPNIDSCFVWPEVVVSGNFAEYTLYYNCDGISEVISKEIFDNKSKSNKVKLKFRKGYIRLIDKKEGLNINLYNSKYCTNL